MDELFEAYGGADLLNSDNDDSSQEAKDGNGATSKGKKDDTEAKSKKDKKLSPAEKQEGGGECEVVMAVAGVSEPATPSSEEGEDVDQGYPGRLQPLE